MTVATMKTCTKCQKTRPTSEFHKDKQKADGLRKWCRDCANKDQRDRKAADPETILTRNRRSTQKWYEENKVWYNAKRRVKHAKKTEV